MEKDKPRIFLGSSGKQAKLLQALTRGLEEAAHVEPWTTSFNPGTTTLERLLELTREVDFAAMVFAQDDWTSASSPSPVPSDAAQASPRDNVVFEAGLFGGVLGMRRTFILHATGSKLPSDLLGLTCVRYGETTPAEIRAVNAKLRKAIESVGRLARIEGLWWQYSLTERTAREPSAVSLLRISRDRSGALEITGRVMGGEREALRPILERGDQGEERLVRSLLLLERRATARLQRAAAVRDGRDSPGVRGSRGRVLHDASGRASGSSTREPPGSTCVRTRSTSASWTGTMTVAAPS